MLIKPEKAYLIIQEGYGRRMAMISFNYKGAEYYPFPVTDFEFMEQTRDLNLGTYKMTEMPILMCSVGECFEQDKCHYKIAAAVFGGKW